MCKSSTVDEGAKVKQVLKRLRADSLHLLVDSTTLIWILDAIYGVKTSRHSHL